MPNSIASLLMAIARHSKAEHPEAIPEPGSESSESELFSCGVSSMTLKNIASDMLDKNCM